MRGPSDEGPYGDAARLLEIAKLAAESLASPYEGAGLYVGVADIRLVSPASAPGCRFTVVADTPFFNCAEPVGISRGKSTPFAVQVVGVSSQPHIFGDAAGQVFLLYSAGGQVCWRRRSGLESPWGTQQMIPNSQRGQEPWGDKDDSGRLIAVWQQGDSELQMAVSKDDGGSWQSVQ